MRRQGTFTRFKHTALLAAIAALSLCSCEHKELCEDHEPHALRNRVEIVAGYEQRWEYHTEGGTDWEAAWPGEFGFSYASLNPALPKGLRTVVYNENDIPRTYNMDVHGGVVPLADGSNDMLLYNNDTEYIVFNDLNSTVTATATTRTRTRPSYKGSMFGSSDGTDEVTVTPPDMLYGASVTGYVPCKTIDPMPLKVLLTPLTYTYYVRIEVEKGQEYVALARGALAGMARGVYLTDGSTTDESATVIFDAEVTGFGAEASVLSFGAPGWPNSHYRSDGGNGSGRRYALNVEIRLRNGKVLSFDYDVTDQLRLQPHGGVIRVGGIEISDDDGKGGSGGFDVDVDGWGDYEDIPIDM